MDPVTPTVPWPPEYRIHRLLSEKAGGVVALAENASGELVALKLLPLRPGSDQEAVLARHRQLQSISQGNHLLSLRAFGLTADRAWLWEELEAADSVDGERVSLAESYVPATLRMERIERGPFGNHEVAEVGLAVAAGLHQLHEAGFVHRDVKPGNFFRVGGQVVLGDYGLTGLAGQIYDFAGTEGFIPPEGNGGPKADLFALGKSLYELWTGCDRLEFPTIPKAVLESSDWRVTGHALNQVLLRSSSSIASERYTTAFDFRSALEEAREGRLRWTTRRRWLTGMGLAFLGGGFAAAFTVLRRKQPGIHWELLNSWGYIPSAWGWHKPVIDSARGKAYQMYVEESLAQLVTIDLNTWEFEARELDIEPKSANQAILHPQENLLWFTENWRGPVWRFDPETLEATQVGERKSSSERDFGNRVYWNPLTGRMGTFGGYGWFAVRNWRWEYDPDQDEWVQLDANDPAREPLCREVPVLVATEIPGQLLMFGGIGNSSGKQGDKDPGLHYFTGQFNVLGDLWVLDLESGNWKCLVPLPGLELPIERTGTYFTEEKALLLLQGRPMTKPNGTPPEAFAFWPAHPDRGFTQLDPVGDPPDGIGSGFLTALPNGKSGLAFYQNGIYRVALET